MDDNKHLRLVTNEPANVDNGPKRSSNDEREYVLGDRSKILILFFIMGVIPLSAYQFGADTWGREVGTHIAVGVGAVCTLVHRFSFTYLDGWMR